ncbi:MAG: hypothetical protein ACYTAF_02885 [Planctomycetota bacterium]|jgi:hypothetical protein
MRVIAAILCSLLLVGAQDEAQEKKEGRVRAAGFVGWKGTCPHGRIVPAWVHLENTAKDKNVVVMVQWGLSGIHQDSTKVTPGRLRGAEGAPVVFPWNLPHGAKHRICVPVRTSGSESSSLWVFVLEKGKMIASGEFVGGPARDEKIFTIGVVGAEKPQGLVTDDVTDVLRVNPDDLPDCWSAYTSLDALLWLDGDPAECRSPAQHEALRNWVFSGGHLVIARSTEAGLKGSFLEDLIPGIAEGTRELERVPAFEYFDGHKFPWKLLVLDVRARKDFVKLEQDRVPLVIEEPRGAGCVTLLAFDASRAPFDRWAGMKTFWKWTLRLPEAGEREYYGGEEEDPKGAMLRSAATSFEGVEPPSLGWLFILLLVYAVVVGPVDYFVLRRLKRFEWTWVTFPTLVIGFAAIVMIFGGAFVLDPIRGREITIRDYYPEEGVRRGMAVASLLPSMDGRFDVEGPAGADYIDLMRTGHGFYGSGGAADMIERHPARIRSLKLQRAVFGSFRTQWLVEGDPAFEIEDTPEGIRLRNGSDVALTDAVLITKDGLVRIGALGRGEELDGLVPSAHDTWKTYAQEWGTQQHYRDDPYGYGYRYYEEEAIEKERLRRWTRSALVQLTLPTQEELSRVAPRSDLVHGTDARLWLSSGGRLLLGWCDPPSSLRCSPSPSEVTGEHLVRVFLPRKR